MQYNASRGMPLPPQQHNQSQCVTIPTNTHHRKTNHHTTLYCSHACRHQPRPTTGAAITCSHMHVCAHREIAVGETSTHVLRPTDGYIHGHMHECGQAVNNTSIYTRIGAFRPNTQLRACIVSCRIACVMTCAHADIHTNCTLTHACNRTGWCTTKRTHMPAYIYTPFIQPYIISVRHESI